jgi:hypothetical protein
MQEPEDGSSQYGSRGACFKDSLLELSCVYACCRDSLYCHFLVNKGTEVDGEEKKPRSILLSQDQMSGAEILEAIAAQGVVVRELKAAKADKETTMAAVSVHVLRVLR